MEDITGLGKLAESKLAGDIYQDGAKQATTELGGALTDVAAMCRLVTGLARASLENVVERVTGYCQVAVSQVPEHRRIPAKASVAGPAITNLTFLEENNPLKDLYIELLARAVDRDRQRDAAPAFVRIIEQLTPEEVLILDKLAKEPILTVEIVGIGINYVHREAVLASSLVLPPPSTLFDLGMFLDHLHALNLVSYWVGGAQHELPYELGKWPGDRVRRGKATLTDYGRWFVQSCVPQ